LVLSVVLYQNIHAKKSHSMKRKGMQD
jgi:hypothetical protein